MEALAFTVILVILMLAALAVLARSWPRSSSFGGYRARSRDDSPAGLDRSEERGEAIREDDDLHWQWDDPDRPR
jgi:hypothetical protein